MEATKELLEALAHVKSIFPEVVMVMLNQFGQWNYCDSNFDSPIFDDRINIEILEEGADSIIELPFIYELPLEEENIWYEVFTSTEDEGTETIARFESLEEAKQFVADNCEQDLLIDKWELVEGENKKIK